MVACPWCDAENISGVDCCDECGQSLTENVSDPPRTFVEKSLLRDRVGKLLPRRAIAVRASTPVREVLDALARNQIGCVLVTDPESDAAGGVVGIFSERDALFRIGTRINELRDRPIREFMTPNVQMLGRSAKIAFAIQMMDVGHYRHIPVVSEGQKSLDGVVSVRDVLRYLSRRMQFDADTES